MDANSFKLVMYQTVHGKVPLKEWILSINDKKSVGIISSQIEKLTSGGLGRRRYVGKAVYELKIFYGAGYRIYYAYLSGAKIILLSGGSKSSQSQDILQAQFYLEDHKRRI